MTPLSRCVWLLCWRLRRQHASCVRVISHHGGVHEIITIRERVLERHDLLEVQVHGNRIGESRCINYRLMDAGCGNLCVCMEACDTVENTTRSDNRILRHAVSVRTEAGPGWAAACEFHFREWRVWLQLSSQLALITGDSNPWVQDPSPSLGAAEPSRHRFKCPSGGR